MPRIVSFIALMTMFSLASIPAFGQTGDKAKVKGIIHSRTGETFVVKSAQGNVTVVLTDGTKTKDNKGLLGARSEKLAREALIPGLKVDVDGTSDNRGQVIATGITVDGDDVETSQMIQAGLTPTATQVASNTERLDALDRRLAAVEGAAAGASTALPGSTQPSTLTQVSTPSPAPRSASATDPRPAPSEGPKTSLNLFRVGLTFAVLMACCIGAAALHHGA